MTTNTERYERARKLAQDKADMLGRDICIMKNAFGGYSFFIASDTSDCAKYEIVRPTVKA